MIDNGDILSIQCKMNLRGPKSMRKIHGPSLIFINYYVSALSPRLDSTEILLQPSENTTLFVVCHIYTGVTSREI
jgi:hypothetical protein